LSAEFSNAFAILPRPDVARQRLPPTNRNEHMSIFNVTATGQSFTLPPATPVLVAPLNTSRKLLMLENTGGANPVTLKFQTAPASATDGFTLDPAIVQG
jgi:hypothetical protein